jgi:glycosyltransferase involved in cell wall biosynthesis
MPFPLVSIIIPCFNAEQYVGDAIRSALEQTYPRKEVIVIDDGSTDCSVEVIKTFESSIVWETGPNKGACAARNRGLQLAQGDRIQFLDADDWLYPQKLERQIACLQASPVATPVCDADVYKEGQVISRHTAPATCDDSLIPLLAHQLQTSSPLHLKSNLLRIGGFREELPCAQERDLHLRLACHGWPIQRVAEPLYAIRRLPVSVSSSYEKVLDQHAAIANRLRAILSERNAWTPDNARAIAGFLTRDARAYMGLNCEKKAAEYFSLAFDFHKSGGWDTAYGKVARLGAMMMGPIHLERLRCWLRNKRSA